MVTAATQEARDQHLLRPQDRVLMKRAHLLHEAKRSALFLADGYRAPQPQPVYAAGRAACTKRCWRRLRRCWRPAPAAPEDAQIARRLAYVLTGGAPAVPTWLDERELLLELERAAFMALAREPHSQACIRHMLRTNRPLRHAG